MTITSAVFWSSDNYRISYVEDGVTKKIKGFDNPLRDVIAAAVTIQPFVVPPMLIDETRPAIVAEFWRRVAAHFGVHPDEARTHLIVNGAPQEVIDLWAKARVLTVETTVPPDFRDDGHWQ